MEAKESNNINKFSDFITKEHFLNSNKLVFTSDNSLFSLLNNNLFKSTNYNKKIIKDKVLQKQLLSGSNKPNNNETSQFKLNYLDHYDVPLKQFFQFKSYPNNIISIDSHLIISIFDISTDIGIDSTETKRNDSSYFFSTSNSTLHLTHSHSESLNKYFKLDSSFNNPEIIDQIISNRDNNTILFLTSCSRLILLKLTFDSSDLFIELIFDQILKHNFLTEIRVLDFDKEGIYIILDSHLYFFCSNDVVTKNNRGMIHSVVDADIKKDNFSKVRGSNWQYVFKNNLSYSDDGFVIKDLILKLSDIDEFIHNIEIFEIKNSYVKDNKKIINKEELNDIKSKEKNGEEYCFVSYKKYIAVFTNKRVILFKSKNSDQSDNINNDNSNKILSFSEYLVEETVYTRINTNETRNSSNTSNLNSHDYNKNNSFISSGKFYLKTMDKDTNNNNNSDSTRTSSTSNKICYIQSLHLFFVISNNEIRAVDVLNKKENFNIQLKDSKKYGVLTINKILYIGNNYLICLNNSEDEVYFIDKEKNKFKLIYKEHLYNLDNNYVINNLEQLFIFWFSEINTGSSFKFKMKNLINNQKMIDIINNNNTQLDNKDRDRDNKFTIMSNNKVNRNNEINNKTTTEEEQLRSLYKSLKHNDCITNFTNTSNCNFDSLTLNAQNTENKVNVDISSKFNILSISLDIEEQEEAYLKNVQEKINSIQKHKFQRKYLSIILKQLRKSSILISRNKALTIIDINNFFSYKNNINDFIFSSGNYLNSIQEMFCENKIEFFYHRNDFRIIVEECLIYLTYIEILLYGYNSFRLNYYLVLLFEKARFMESLGKLVIVAIDSNDYKSFNILSNLISV